VDKLVNEEPLLVKLTKDEQWLWKMKMASEDDQTWNPTQMNGVDDNEPSVATVKAANRHDSGDQW